MLARTSVSKLICTRWYNNHKYVRCCNSSWSLPRQFALVRLWNSYAFIWSNLVTNLWAKPEILHHAVPRTPWHGPHDRLIRHGWNVKLVFMVLKRSQYRKTGFSHAARSGSTQGLATLGRHVLVPDVIWKVMSLTRTPLTIWAKQRKRHTRSAQRPQL